MLSQLRVLDGEYNGEVICGRIRGVGTGESQTDIQDTGGSGDRAEVTRGTYEGPYGVGSQAHGGKRSAGFVCVRDWPC